MRCSRLESSSTAANPVVRRALVAERHWPAALMDCFKPNLVLTRTTVRLRAGIRPGEQGLGMDSSGSRTCGRVFAGRDIPKMTSNVATN